MSPQPRRGQPAGAARLRTFVPDRPLFDRIAALIPGAQVAPQGPPPEPAVPAVRFAVQRARDLLVLDVEARGMRLETTGEAGPRLVVADGQADKARFIVGFPPQHIGEQAWPEPGPPDQPPPGPPTPPPGHDVLAAARFARFSRLAFAVPAGEEIAFSSEGVLAAMRRLVLVVVPVATPRPADKPSLGDLFGHLHLPGGLVLAQSAEGLVLSAAGRAAPAPAALGGVDDLLRDSASLRALRVRLATDAALDIRRVAAPAAGIAAGLAAATRVNPLLGPGGLAVVNPFPRPPRRAVPARAPRDDETAIEAPWRLILSPSDLEGFTHADVPVGPSDPIDALEPQAGRERIELWHSRLGMRRVDTQPDGTELLSIDERADRQKIVRAIWARERELFAQDPGPNDDGPFLTSLSPHDRWELVLQSAETLVHATGNVGPQPVDVKGLALSALGAWLDVHGNWEAERYGARGVVAPIKSWDHVAPMGRDQFVQVVYVGYLFPLGHKAVLIKQTERKVRESTNPVARLYQRWFIVVAEPERTHGVNDLPWTSVRFVTLVTPPLQKPADQTRFWPTLTSGQDMIFTIETVDHDGRHARKRMPLLFLDVSRVLSASAADATSTRDLYRTDARAKVPVDGQRIAFARSLRPGDTSAEVRSLRLDATFEGPAGDNRKLQPRLHAAEIVPATSKLLTPTPETFHANYHPTFAASGFPDAPGAGGNAADLFLQVVDAAQVTKATIPLPATLPKVSFGSTDKSGGFVDPAQQIAGLTRRLGTVGNLDGALAGSFDPAALLGQAFPKLFGLFRLTDLLGPLGLDKAPKFVTEALGPIQGLLADLAALQAALQRAVAQASALQAHADDVANALGDLTAALAVLLDPTVPHDPATATAQLQGLLGAFTTTVNELDGLVATLPLSPLARSDLQKLLRGVQPYLADGAKIAAAVEQVLAFVDGLDPENLEVRAKLEWTTELGQFPKAPDAAIFKADDPLRIAIEARAGAKTGASFDAVAEMTNFSLTLVAPASLMKLRFDRLAFRAGSSGKPDVDVVFGGIEFVGPLSFVETLKELIPLDGFSDPPFLDVSPAGVRAGFTLALPNVAIGVFALQNISLGADCNVPFLGQSVSVGFNFCTRERPFALTVAFIGGGGFLGLRVSPQGLELLELSLEAGARLAVDLGIASGSIEAMIGIYMRLEGKKGSLTGYFRLRGEVDVLGLISASIELSLELEYEPPTGKMTGRATLTIEVEVFMFSFSVSVSVERQFAGSNGDPTFAEIMAVSESDGSSERWDLYCDAFA